jgi:hypothetical protein
VDGLPHVVEINALAPYVLTASIGKPQRLLSEGGVAGATSCAV